MSYRVNHEEVEQIFQTDIEDLSPFIAVADTLVTDKLTGQGLSTTMLKEITRWLSAHFAAINDPRSKQEKVGEASATFFLGKEGTGISATPYGQQALVLDTTGILSALGNKQQAKLEAIV